MKTLKSLCLFGSVIFVASSFTVPVHASDTGAFIGGMLTSRVLGNMHDRTEAEQEQADAAQQQAYSSSQAQQVQQAPPPPAKKSVEQQMKELDSLAAGGYISKEEYKTKKQAIIDSI